MGGGAGVRESFGPCILNNCTLTDNTSIFAMGGGARSCTLNNCILYYNTQGQFSKTEDNYDMCTLDYCCTTPLPASGVGNTDQAPAFVNPAGGDYHLQSGSPCINTGLNQDWMIGSTDLDGNPRIGRGVVDMGAYEFQFPNHPPLAGSDTVGTIENRPVAAPVVKLLANDTDPDGDVVMLTAASTTSAEGGTVVLDGGVVTYTPPVDFAGEDSFTYTVSDGYGGTAEGTVAVTITPINAPTLNQVSIKVEGHRRLVRFAGIPGQIYIIQWTADLCSPAWTDVSPPIAAGATGLVQYQDLTDPPPGQRFYRTKVAP
jgi:hypothetical protein